MGVGNAEAEEEDEEKQEDSVTVMSTSARVATQAVQTNTEAGDGHKPIR